MFSGLDLYCHISCTTYRNDGCRLGDLDRDLSDAWKDLEALSRLEAWRLAIDG